MGIDVRSDDGAVNVDIDIGEWVRSFAFREMYRPRPSGNMRMMVWIR
jgi:hypothetical protein